MKVYFCLVNILFFATFAFSQSISRKTYEYAESLAEQSAQKYEWGDYKEAIRLGYDALPIYEKVFGKKENKDYAACLSNIALYYSKLGEYKEAIRLSGEELELTGKIFGCESKEYIHSLLDLGAYYFGDKNYTEALYFDSKALNIGRIVYNENSRENKELAIIKYSVAVSNAMLGNYKESTNLCKDALHIFMRNSDEEIVLECKRLLYGNLLNTIKQEIEKENYKEIEDMVAECKALLKEIEPEEIRTFSNLLSMEANCYENQGRFSVARKKILEQIDILEKNKKNYLKEYLLAKKGLANMESTLGNSESAESILKEIINISNNSNEKIIDEDFGMLTDIAQICTHIGDYYSASNFLDKAFNKVKNKKDIEPKTLYELYFAYAYQQRKLEFYEDAISSYNDALKLIPRVDERYMAILYRNTHRELGFCYLAIGDYKKAYEHYSDAITFANSVNESSYYVDYVVGVLWCAYLNNYQKVVCENIARLEELIRKFWKNNLFVLSEEDRNLFFMNYGAYIEWLIPRMVYEYPQSESIISSGYDASLIHKGLLVDVSRALNSVQQKNDYNEIISTKWTDIREKLKENDVAVEFISFPFLNDSTIYMAYVLKKGMEYPTLVKLFEEQQLKNTKDIYTTSELSKLIWEPLSKYLNGAKNVYFSPSGELYNIAIESLPHWSDGCLMSDKWNMYRLSSTRELVLVKNKDKIKQATIYGGVEYDTDEQTLAANSRMFARTHAMNTSSLYQLADTLNMRSGVNYLPSTKDEAVEIDKTLRSKHVKTNLRTESLATESDFKNLDGKNVNLIHVATHGFYWTEREAKYHDDLSFLMIDNRNLKYVEDKALTRSGLLMAGANNALMGKQLPEGVDDGILTAKEISQLDLRGSDLVVLSACQTGLGEIKGDGVFGLQRGFKKAGVSSILMSLWKVDDDATKLLMTQFYKNLISGISKHEALRQAQKNVREYKVKNYQDPYYWAAFVLLDAID